MSSMPSILCVCWALSSEGGGDSLIKAPPTLTLISPAHLSSSLVIFVQNDRTADDLRRANMISMFLTWKMSKDVVLLRECDTTRDEICVDVMRQCFFFLFPRLGSYGTHPLFLDHPCYIYIFLKKIWRKNLYCIHYLFVICISLHSHFEYTHHLHLYKKSNSRYFLFFYF